jgi:Trk K+ transport system NAD-binding subunit
MFTVVDRDGVFTDVNDAWERITGWRREDLVGKSLKDAGFPRGCVVAAITREDGTVLIPRGDDELHAHDQMVVFVLGAMVDKVLALAGIERDD